MWDYSLLPPPKTLTQSQSPHSLLAPLFQLNSFASLSNLTLPFLSLYLRHLFIKDCMSSREGIIIKTKINKNTNTNSIRCIRHL